MCTCWSVEAGTESQVGKLIVIRASGALSRRSYFVVRAFQTRQVYPHGALTEYQGTR